MLLLRGREVVEPTVLASEARRSHAPGTCLEERCGVDSGSSLVVLFFAVV